LQAPEVFYPVRSKKSTQGSSLSQQGPRGASFYWIKDRFSFRDLPDPHASRLAKTICNPPRNGPRKALGCGPTPPADHRPSSFVRPPSGCLTIIVVQHSAQPLAAADGSSATDA
jgi:hypothetical protein